MVASLAGELSTREFTGGLEHRRLGTNAVRCQEGETPSALSAYNAHNTHGAHGARSAHGQPHASH
jgi:hypothetical protein